MKFDPKTGKLIMPGKIEQKGTTIAQIDVVDPSAEEKTLPVTNAQCPKCNHKKAYFWLVQTRAGDEPETKFHKCVACKHTWRDYK